MCKPTTFKKFYANLQMEDDHGCSYDALLVTQEPHKYLWKENPSSFPNTLREKNEGQNIFN